MLESNWPESSIWGAVVLGILFPAFFYFVYDENLVSFISFELGGNKDYEKIISLAPFALMLMGSLVILIRLFLWPTS